MEVTQHTPADVRERLEELLDVLVTAAQRYGAVHGTNYVPCMEGVEMGKARRAVVEFALLLRTPRGEGEAAAMFANLARALAAMQAAWIEWRSGRGADAAMQWIENTLIGPGLIPGDDESDAQAFFDRAIAEIENHQIRHAAALRSEAQGEEDAVRRTWELAVRRAYGCLDYRGGYRGAELEAFHAGIKTVIRALEAGPDAADTQAAALDRIGAALRSEANGDEADALDLIRWAESQGAVLEPVAGNIMPPGTYACYVGDDDDPYMGPGILGAIRAARRGEGGGDG